MAAPAARALRRVQPALRSRHAVRPRTGGRAESISCRCRRSCAGTKARDRAGLGEEASLAKIPERRDWARSERARNRRAREVSGRVAPADRTGHHGAPETSAPRSTSSSSARDRRRGRGLLAARGGARAAARARAGAGGARVGAPPASSQQGWRRSRAWPAKPVRCSPSAARSSGGAGGYWSRARPGRRGPGRARRRAHLPRACASTATPGEAAERMPLLDASLLEGAAFYADGGVIDAHALVTGLLAEARRRRRDASRPTCGRSPRRRRRRGGSSTTTDVAASAVVIAGGAWSANRRRRRAPLPLAPYRRHLALLRVAPPRTPLVYSWTTSRTRAPRRAGCSPALRRGGWPPGAPAVDDRALALLCEKLACYLPAAASARVAKAWACQRTFAPIALRARRRPARPRPALVRGPRRLGRDRRPGRGPPRRRRAARRRADRSRFMRGAARILGKSWYRP